MLILRGASRIGKTKLAQSIFPNSYVTTVNGAGEPDLRGFKRGFHQCVVLDQVNDLQFILNNRAVLQANAEDQHLGVTQSHNFSYEVWLHRIPIILTVDLEVKMEDFDESDWLSHNCVKCDLGTTPTYDKHAPARGEEPEECERDPLAYRVCSLSELLAQSLSGEERQMAERSARLGDLALTLGPKDDPPAQFNEIDYRQMAPETLADLPVAQYRAGLTQGLYHDDDEEAEDLAGFPEPSQSQEGEDLAESPDPSPSQ